MNDHFSSNTSWFIKGKHNFHWHRNGELVKIDVLDHGYVQFIEAWGKGSEDLESQEFEGGVDWERGIIEAARQSTQGSFRGWSVNEAECSCGLGLAQMGNPALQHKPGCNYLEQRDEKLLHTLYHHQSNQSTPFEAAGMTIEVQAPIMVFREWHRHRTQSYNEASARYIKLPDLYYHIKYEDLINRAMEAQQEKNRQAGPSTKVALNTEAIRNWLLHDEYLSAHLEEHYQAGLNLGIPKELARKKMPVDHYSRMRATANLRNWLAFLTLRLAPNAQWEIRQYAEAVLEILKVYFPRTTKLFVDSR